MSYNQDEDGVSGLYTSTPWSTISVLKTIDMSFRNLITEKSPQSSQPSHITVPLKPHQRALLYAIAEREQACMNGIQYKNTLTYSNYGVLGDEVGTGKSLTILSYISYLKDMKASNLSSQKPPTNTIVNMLCPNSRKFFFTVYKKEVEATEGPCLLVVPHTIYRQWQDYCKKQTTLDVFFAKSNKDLPSFNNNSVSVENQTIYQEKQNAFLKKVRESDAVLVSNTLYGELQRIADNESIQWKRVFIDEVDSIYISGGTAKPKTAFTWFISATWPNFILEGLYIRPLLLEYYKQNLENFTPELGEWLNEEIVQKLNNGSENSYGRTTYMNIRSTRWLEQYHSDHLLRGMIVLLCSKSFLKESRKMPNILEKHILCKQPVSHRILKGFVNSTIQTMLHAGNIEGALQELGVPTDTTLNLIEIVTIEKEKELERLKKIFVFKESMDYSTAQSKEAALEILRGKIASIELQLKTFRERLLNITIEDCPICYENPRENSGTLTPCCHRIFCGGCILNSLTRTMACPMCRSSIQPSQLTQLVEASSVSKTVSSTENELLSKQKQLLKLLKDEPNARVLIFSRYENPFLHLERDCDIEGITYTTLRGNKDMIASTIRSFEKGEKRVLFLSTEFAGAGLNLVSATHVILLHAMTMEEQKQVIGRAYRLGRTEDLTVIHLLHEGETLHN